MGALPFSSILSTGLNIAGRTDLAPIAQAWLNAWLRSQYKSWQWPFLYRRTTGVPLNAGVTSITFGAGNSGVTNEVQQVRDPIWVYTTDYAKRMKARVSRLIDGHLYSDESVNNPAMGQGIPTHFKVRANATKWGAWDLIPHPVPEVNYVLAVDYLEQPADIIDTSQTPLYPNDHTMYQAVLVATQQYFQNTSVYLKENELLTSMAIGDRVKYGMVEGTNSELSLDGGIFL